MALVLFEGRDDGSCTGTSQRPDRETHKRGVMDLGECLFTITLWNVSEVDC